MDGIFKFNLTHNVLQVSVYHHKKYNFFEKNIYFRLDNIGNFKTAKMGKRTGRHCL
jgi:hypothetical protein